MVEPAEELQVVFDKAIKDAKKNRHEYVTIEHLFFAMHFMMKMMPRKERSRRN